MKHFWPGTHEYQTVDPSRWWLALVQTHQHQTTKILYMIMTHIRVLRVYNIVKVRVSKWAYKNKDSCINYRCSLNKIATMYRSLNEQEPSSAVAWNGANRAILSCEISPTNLTHSHCFLWKKIYFSTPALRYIKEDVYFNGNDNSRQHSGHNIWKWE